ncbi:MAG: hypothetical protein WB510_16485 [Candidatus Sulfotelmatobacter sp.]
MRQTLVPLILLLCIALLAPLTWAQSPPPADTLKVDYFANANTSGAPDAVIQLTNPNTSGGNIYAAIYIFDPNQEMSECCQCLLTPDGLRTVWINPDLTGNPLTGVTLTTGLIKVVSTTGSNASKLVPKPAVRGWATHLQNTTFAATETAMPDATLSSAEMTRLQQECGGILTDGSGHGICTCGSGD